MTQDRFRLGRTVRSILIGATTAVLASLVVNVVFALTYTPDSARLSGARIVVLSHFSGAISKRRVDAGVEIFHRHGAVGFIMTGKTIAPVMAERAAEAGVPADLVRLEDRARTTLENALYTRALVSDPRVPTILVTDRYHLLRSYWIFRWAGFSTLVMVPADDPSDYLSATGILDFGMETAKWFVNLGRIGLAEALGGAGAPGPWHSGEQE